MRRIGLDLAFRAPHQAAVFDDAVPVGRPFEVDRTKAGMDELERRATAGAEGPCEVIMEPTGLAWIPMAAEMNRRGHRIYVPKPQKTYDLRRVYYSAHAKSDGIDATVEALVRHVDPLGVHELCVPTATETALRLSVKHRARRREEAAGSKNRIHGWLVLANPHLSEAFGESMFTKIGIAFLRRFVDPFEVRKLGKKRLRRFWDRHAHGAVRPQLFEAVWRACVTSWELYNELHKAGKLPIDYPRLQQLVSQELDLIVFLDTQVVNLETTNDELYQQLDPDRVLERQVPGLGKVIAPAVEALVGDVERFDNIKCFASYFGVVPCSSRTGGKDKPRRHMTKAGPNLLKQYIFLAADVARRCDPELAVTYARAIEKGKHHNAAVAIVAHKLVRKIYALLKLRAERRRALAEAQPDQPPPAVAYLLVDPDSGKPLSRPQARAYINTHFPSKAKRKATAAAAATSQKPGSPKQARASINTSVPSKAEKRAAAATSQKPGSPKAPPQ